MTVVSTLRLSQNKGMAAADSRRTGKTTLIDQYRKGTVVTDDTNKFYLFGKLPFYAGISGRLMNAHNVMDFARQHAGMDCRYRQVLDAIKTAYVAVKEKEFERAFAAKYKMSWEEYRAQNPQYKRKRARRKLANTRKFSTYILVAGYDQAARQFRMHTVGYPGEITEEEKYASIGSGCGHALSSINRALEEGGYMYRDIEVYQGAMILMRATASARKDPFVEGQTKIVWNTKDTVHQLESEESRLLDNVLQLEERKLVDGAFTRSVFQRIMNDRAKAQELAAEVQREAGEMFGQKILTQFLLR